VSQSALTMPELLWKAYIDFEVDEQGDREKACSIYERLIGLSGHHKVWISYAEFEAHLFICRVHCQRKRRMKKTARRRWCLGTQSWHDRSSSGVTRTSGTKSSKLRYVLMLKLSDITLTPTMFSVLHYWRHGRHSNKLTAWKRTWQRYRA